MNNTTPIRMRVAKLRADAVIPKYQSAGAACFDLHSIEENYVPGDGARTFDTGLAFEVPAGHVLLCFSRSGHGFKNDTRLANCVGVIDSDYRGELRVRLTCDDAHASALWINKGDRIAQAMLVPIPNVTLVEVGPDELSETERGANGYGSTGK